MQVTLEPPDDGQLQPAQRRLGRQFVQRDGGPGRRTHHRGDRTHAVRAPRTGPARRSERDTPADRSAAGTPAAVLRERTRWRPSRSQAAAADTACGAADGACCGWEFDPGWAIPHRGRRRHHRDDPVDHLGRGDVVGHGVEAEHHPVGHHVLGHGLHVGGQHVVPAVDQGQRAGGGDQAQGGPRAAADLDHRGQVGKAELRRAYAWPARAGRCTRRRGCVRRRPGPAAAATGSAAGRAPACAVGGSTLIRRRISNSSLPAG